MISYQILEEFNEEYFSEIKLKDNEHILICFNC